MMRLEPKQYWRWTDTEPAEAEAELWRQTWDNYQPFNAVVERGVLCGKCGREAEVLFFDPKLDTETDAEMREAAKRLMREARQRVEKDPEKRCGDHRLRWALEP